MKSVKFIQCMFFLLLLCGCSHNSEPIKKYDSQKNIVNVNKEIKKIKIEEKDISIFGIPYILNEYLIISDYKSPDKLIHLFNKNTFSYITSVGNRGEGPGEIANMGSIIANKKEDEFYVIDHGRQKILSYKVDSILNNSSYIPNEKITINNTEFPSNFQYINDTLSFSLFIKRLENGDYKPVVSKWNMQTGETVFMNYTGHPEIKKKRVSFSSSVEHKLYVEAYWYNDLMSICTLDGNLKYNLYGDNWNNENSNRNRYFRDVAFCGDKIIASYLGSERLSKEEKQTKVNYPTKLLVFDLNGNYIATLETEYPVIIFCYDNDNNRIILALDDEYQFGYLDLENIL